jgi:hypothetical protein
MVYGAHTIAVGAINKLHYPVPQSKDCLEVGVGENVPPSVIRWVAHSHIRGKFREFITAISGNAKGPEWTASRTFPVFPKTAGKYCNATFSGRVQIYLPRLIVYRAK